MCAEKTQGMRKWNRVKKLIMAIMTAIAIVFAVACARNQIPAAGEALQSQEVAPASAQATGATQASAPTDGYLLRYYANDNLGFALHIVDGWTVTEGDDRVVFAPPEGYFGGGSPRLYIRLVDDGPMATAIMDIDGIVEKLMNEEGGSEAVIRQAGNVRLAHVDAYGVEFGTALPEGDVQTTNLYIVDGGNDDRYHIYYTRTEETNGEFVNAVEEVLGNFTIAAQAEDAPVEEETGDGRNKIEFTRLVGESTPDDIIAMYGNPSEEAAGEIGGVEYLHYIYNGFLVSFAKDSAGQDVVDGVSVYSAASPVAVGGVLAMQTYDEADAALRKNGYKFDPELEDMFGALYYTGGEGGQTKAVLLYVEDGKVAEAEGWYGATADFVLSLAD